MIRSLRIVLALCATLTISLAQAADPIERRICVFDLAGNVGPVMTAMKDWQTAALQWGLKAKLVAYTNEAIAAEDLKAGVCDASLITGLRARKFNKYVGTVDAIGAMPTMEHMKVLLQVLADPRSAKPMSHGDYEVIGLAPAGAAYIFVNDRAIDSLAKAAGKKMAVLEFDETQAIMVAQAGATPVSSDITNFSTKFNNGVVDMIAAPLVVYEVLELYKGLSPDGGIIDYPLLQLSIQLVANKARFPERIAQQSREYFYNNLDRVIEQLQREAATVNDKWWVQIPDSDKQEYELMMQEGRTQLQQRGFYDADMLALQKRIRCKLDPTRAECT
ncbi:MULTISPECIES: putative solute-binding protein [Alcanivorax]|uniref:putative solute-binding protein n=1 Tax=Alcanivorax TaxID=59753 RepID=UPI00105F1164|nr:MULTISPECIES: putative solute-binding protein [Alcanivorax]